MEDNTYFEEVSCEEFEDITFLMDINGEDIKKWLELI